MLSKVNDLIEEELSRAKFIHTKWPLDIIHAAAVVAEEAGELTRASLNTTYHDADCEQECLREAVHVAATAIRFIENYFPRAGYGGYKIEKSYSGEVK